MSNPDDTKTPAEDAAKNTPKGDYDVGYCKPPADHRFKPGNNANPRGRQKGARNRKVLVREILLEPVSVREGDTVKTMSKIQAVITQTINAALKGDHKARLASIAIAREEGLLTPEQEEAIDENLPERDKAIMEDFKRRYGARQSAPVTAAAVQPPNAPASENPPPNATQSLTPSPLTPPRRKITRPVD